MKALRRLRWSLVHGLQRVGASYGSASAAPHRLRSYVDADGTFDYERYRAIQTAGNKRKLENVFADEVTCRAIRDAVHADGVVVRHILCHGSRNGAEIGWFRSLFAEVGPEPDVTGTDISDTADNFPDTVRWDFHDTREDWVGRFDLVYTNSHDHAYDPKKAFRAWVGQLAPGGRLVIEHTTAHEPDAVTDLDPFGIDPMVLPYFVLEIAEGEFSVRRLVRPGHRKKGKWDVWVFLIASEERG